MNDSSGICKSCFENGNHEGHDCHLMKGCIGVCDCGDPESWFPSGFCKDHQGYDESKITIDLLPPYLKQVSPIIIHFLVDKLNGCALDYEQLAVDDNLVDIKSLYTAIMILCKLSEISTIFSKMICHKLNERMYAVKSKVHVCNKKIFLSDDEEKTHKMIYEKKLAEAKTKDPDAAICECKLLENLLKIIHFMDKPTIDLLCDYLLKMVKSPLLKDILGYGLLSNYKSLILGSSFDRITTEDQLEKVSLQIFTVDTLAYRYMNNVLCRDTILEVFGELLNQSKNWKNISQRDVYVRLFNLKRDLKYFNKEKTMTYLVDKTDIIEKLLEKLTIIEFEPLYSLLPIDSTIPDEQAGPNLMPFLDKYWMSILKRFVETIDYSNFEDCRRFGLTFRKLIKQQSLKSKETPEIANGEMYLSIQFHRIFYTFFATLLHTRLVMEGNYFANDISTQKLRLLSRSILKANFTENNSDEDLDEMIEEALEIVLTPLLFMIEIRGKKWSKYSDYLNGFANFYYIKQPINYSFPDFCLVQLLVGLYDGKGKNDILEFLLSLKKKQDYLQWINDIIEKGKIEDDPSIDGQKITMIMEALLHLLCCLSSNNCIVFLPLIRLFYTIHGNRLSLESIKPIAEKTRSYYIKKSLAQCSMLFSNGQFLYHDFLKSLTKKM